MNDNPVLRIVAKIIIPMILLFALYVQFHGDYGPGGGFQAGVIFAAGFILYGLVFGTEALRSAVPPHILRIFIALGLVLYAGVGVTTLLMEADFLA
ncbi:MAG: Na(+)/H(+) antiporter subunit B, partial [Proteobacteria bacterium]|nr:Na(+)/H(+) antiporter subunit B [Pseudomonadota bacterium]